MKTKHQASLDLLRKCAKQFRYYQTQHVAKNTADSLAKAEVNRKLADEIEKHIAFMEDDGA